MKLNIYINGVGGQGIGVLSELIIQAYHYAGFYVKGVDTHGLAQRGGSVESHIRVGAPSGSPIIEAGFADLVLSLERTEAFRAMQQMLGENGSLAYYDASWQSLSVRLGNEVEIDNKLINETAEKRGIKVLRVKDDGLKDIRTQNITLLSRTVNSKLLIGIEIEHLKSALSDLFSGDILKLNINKLFEQTK